MGVHIWSALYGIDIPVAFPNALLQAMDCKACQHQLAFDKAYNALRRAYSS
jgi:hypothetical protein